MKLPRRTAHFCSVVVMGGVLVGGLAASGRAAGPPFITDDPEPVDYQHWEVYVATQHLRATFGHIDTLPHFEVNYGIAPNTQLHLIAPFAYAHPAGGITHYGFSDVELGVKYRFLQETRSRPQVGTFPLLEAPTGNSAAGLGNGTAQVFLPVWAQKSWGPWTTYGGGGYWHNPAATGRDFWYAGWLLQRSVTRRLAVGAEAFTTTPQSVGESSRTGFNVGGIYDFDEGHHFLFSFGKGLHGPAKTTIYAAYQWTFGPPHAAGEHG